MEEIWREYGREADVRAEDVQTNGLVEQCEGELLFLPCRRFFGHQGLVETLRVLLHQTFPTSVVATTSTLDFLYLRSSFVICHARTREVGGFRGMIVKL